MDVTWWLSAKLTIKVKPSSWNQDTLAQSASQPALHPYIEWTNNPVGHALTSRSLVAPLCLAHVTEVEPTQSVKMPNPCDFSNYVCRKNKFSCSTWLTFRAIFQASQHMPYAQSTLESKYTTQPIQVLFHTSLQLIDPSVYMAVLYNFGCN